MQQTVAVTLLLSTLLVSTQASLPSQGIESFAEVRGMLPDKAFKFDLKDAIVLENEDYKARFVNVKKNPALAAQDVQFHFVDLVIKPGKSFFRHTHPRSAEAVFIVKGKVKVSFWFEGPKPRIVRNVVNSGEFAVVPQGLPHEVTCVSKRDCFFVVFFKTADPGLIPA